MVAFGTNSAVRPDRREAPRDEVYHRTRASSYGAGSFPVHIVNVSATGFMARTETELAPGASLSVRLPVLGELQAEVRWALAGRIGCQFAEPIGLADYLGLLGALAKEAR